MRTRTGRQVGYDDLFGEEDDLRINYCIFVTYTPLMGFYRSNRTQQFEGTKKDFRGIQEAFGQTGHTDPSQGRVQR